MKIEGTSEEKWRMVDFISIKTGERRKKFSFICRSHYGHVHNARFGFVAVQKENNHGKDAMKLISHANSTNSHRG